MAMTGGQKANINMTPMIDVLLVLIIIFMVIVPDKSRGLEALVPQPSPTVTADPEPSHPIVITVLADGRTMLNQETLEIDALRTRLERLYRTGASQAVFVRAEAGLEFGAVATVIDIAHLAGVTRVALMPK